MTDLPDPTHACDLIKEGPGQTCPAGLPVPRGSVLTRSALRSVAVLVLLCLLVTGINLLWTAHEVHANAAQQAREQDTARREGQVMVSKLCLTFGRLAALKPPPGNPKTNPSRAFDQQEHATLVGLGADLGCKAG